MYIILPLSTCKTIEKRDRFLEHLYKIAETTLDNEIRTQSYAWFRHAEDNDAEPTSWVRGFEAYDNVAASTQVHRSSNEYKAMRQAAGSEGFFEKPSDLRYLRPIGRDRVKTTSGEQLLFQRSRIDRLGEQYLVVDEITPREGNKADIVVALAELRSVLANRLDLVKLVLALEYLPEYEDDTVASVILYNSRHAYKSCAAASNEVDQIFEKIDGLCEERQHTTWLAAGIGFIGR